MATMTIQGMKTDLIDGAFVRVPSDVNLVQYDEFDTIKLFRKTTIPKIALKIGDSSHGHQIEIFYDDAIWTVSRDSVQEFL